MSLSKVDMNQAAYIKGYMDKMAGANPFHPSMLPLLLGPGIGAGIGGAVGATTIGGDEGAIGGMVVGGIGGSTLGILLSRKLMRKRGRKQLANIRGKIRPTPQDQRNLAVLEQLEAGGEL